MIIDVGANKGDFILPIAESNPDKTCVAIEPIPWLAEEIRSKASERKLKNLENLEYAVCEIDGEVDLNISEIYSGGTSSILEFDPNLRLNEYWRNRHDLVHSRVIKVKSAKLQTILDFLYKEKEEIIEFIKIDIQGLDLVALKLIGKWLRNVNMGMLESAATKLDALYLLEKFDLEESIRLVRDLGFEIYGVRPNDEGFKEYNIYFNNPGIEVKKVEEELGLAENKIYLSNLGITEIISSYENSISWKLTKPLRMIKNGF